MKNKRLLGLATVFAFTLAIGMTSCKKDKDDNNGAASKFSATIGTTAFAPQYVTAVDLGSEIWITAYAPKAGGDSSVLQLIFPNNVTLNSAIDITSQDVTLEYYNTKETLDYDASFDSHGSITVTALDKTAKKITGTFNGVLYQTPTDSVVIKDGKFNTTYLTY